MSYPGISPYIDIMQFGADPTGANACDTAYANAVTAAGGNAAVIHFPAGKFTFVNTTAISSIRGSGIIGAGPGATILQFSGTPNQPFITVPAGTVQTQLKGFTAKPKPVTTFTASIALSNSVFWGYISTSGSVSTLHVVGVVRNSGNTGAGTALAIGNIITGINFGNYTIQKGTGTGGSPASLSQTPGCVITGGSGLSWTITAIGGGVVFPIGAPNALVQFCVASTMTTTSVTGTALSIGMLIGGGDAVPEAVAPGCQIIGGSGTTWSISLATSIGSTVFFGYTRPSTGNYLIDVGAGTTTDETFIENIEACYGYIGLLVAGQGSGRIRDCFIHDNISDGLNATTSSSVLEWFMDYCWCQGNGGNGYTIIGTGVTAAALAWSRLNSGANGGFGAQITNVAQVRLDNCFMGTDILGEISISGGQQYYRHLLTQCNVEQCQAGHGFNFIGSNSGGSSLVNCSGQTCAGAGVIWNVTSGAGNDDLSITGGNFDWNGSGIQGATYGGVSAFVGTVTINGIRSMNAVQAIDSNYATSSNQYNQQFGVVNSGATFYGGGNHLGTNSGTLPTTYTFQF